MRTEDQEVDERADVAPDEREARSLRNDRDDRRSDRRQPADAEAEDSAGHKEQRGGALAFLRRHRLAVGLGLIVLLAAVTAGLLYWEHASHFESTDDAFIDAREFSLAPKVSGYLTAVRVTDNQHVATGEVIALIDSRDYEVAVNEAAAAVDSARAAIGTIDARIAAQRAQVTEAQAGLDQTRAALTFAEDEAARFGRLAKTGAGPERQAQQATSNLQQQQAEVARAQSAVRAAEREVSSLQAQRVSAEADLARAQAQLDQARLNLSYTQVVAPQAGRIARLGAAVGQYVSAGTSLAMFVPDEIWVTANFKETQLTRMRPGQPASIGIDAYPDRDIGGHVDSVQPGSGTAFSLLPAQNATGNYVKVVQRVPVKLVMDRVQRGVTLGPGMSVVPSVRVQPEPSWYERLTGGR